MRRTKNRMHRSSRIANSSTHVPAVHGYDVYAVYCRTKTFCQNRGYSVKNIELDPRTSSLLARSLCSARLFFLGSLLVYLCPSSQHPSSLLRSFVPKFLSFHPFSYLCISTGWTRRHTSPNTCSLTGPKQTFLVSYTQNVFCRHSSVILSSFVLVFDLGFDPGT